MLTSRALGFAVIAGAAGTIACNDNKKIKSDKKGNLGGRKNHYIKKDQLPVKLSAIQNRGWYQNQKSKKIHYFDDRGFTPALRFIRSKQEFDHFIGNLKQYDHSQLTAAVFESQVCKKHKDWIAEYAVLSLASQGLQNDAFDILKNRIEKKPLNYRLWDLEANLAFKSGNEAFVQNFRQLVDRYRTNADKKLAARFSKFESEAWQQKIKEKQFSWNKQKI